MARKTAGRQRVEMKKIENEEALQVTFSKRRTGVFKKASELAILCGAEVVIIVFSPAGRPYTFGSPDVETVAQRFLTGNPVRPNDPYVNRGVLVRQLVREYTDIMAVRDMEKARLRELEKDVKESGVLDIEALGAEELEQVLGSMEGLKGRLVAHLDHLKYMDSMSSHDHVVNPRHEQATGPSVIHGHPMAQYGGNPMGHMGSNEFVSAMGQMNPGLDHYHFNPSGQHANDMTGSMGFNDGMYMGSFGFQYGESSSSNANVAVPGRASDQPFGPSDVGDPMGFGFHPFENH